MTMQVTMSKFDEWSNWSTYNGTDYSISMIRLGTVEMSNRPMSIHHLEKIEDTKVEAFVGSSTTDFLDPEKHDGLLFDTGAAFNALC